MVANLLWDRSRGDFSFCSWPWRLQRQGHSGQQRARGWAEAVNEREIGVASIAAPIRDISDEVIAAISIGVPLARCSVTALRRRWIGEREQYGRVG